MRNAQTIESLTVEAERRKLAAEDIVLPLRDLSVQDGAFHVDGYASPIRPTNRAIGQLATTLEIPVHYLRKIWHSDRTVNQCIQHAYENVGGLGDTDKLFRLHHGRDNQVFARAILSERYQPIDAVDMLRALNAVQSSMSGTELSVRGADLTSNGMYVQFTDNRLQGETRKGDLHKGGFSLSTDEVGEGFCEVLAYIYRQVCSNGMMGIAEGAIWKRKHVRSSVWDFAALCEGIERGIEDALSGEAFARSMGRLQAATARPVSLPDTDSVDALVKRLTLQEPEAEAFKRSIVPGVTTQYDIAQAVTALAHTAKGERAWELERIGTEYVAA